MRFSIPVLEPDLHRSLGHVDGFCDPLSSQGSRCGIFVELVFKRDELILSCSLSLLIFLLLGEGALPGWPS